MKTTFWEHPEWRGVTERSSSGTKLNQQSQAFFAVAMFVIFFLLFTSSDQVSGQFSLRLWLSSFLYLFLGIYAAYKYVSVPQDSPRHLVEDLSPLQDHFPPVSPPRKFQDSQPIAPLPQQVYSSDSYTPSPWGTKKEETPVIKTSNWGPTSPISPKLKKIDVVNTKSLECYLKTFGEEEELRSKVTRDTTGPLPDWQATQPPATYRTMIPPPIANEPKKDQKFKLKLSYHEVYAKLGIEYSIERWSDNLRLWFSRMILNPLVETIDSFNKMAGIELHKMKAPTQINNQANPMEPAKGAWQWSTVPSAASSVTAQLANQIDSQKDKLILQTLVPLEKYVAVLGATSKEFVIQRIRDLARDHVVSQFHWRGENDNVTDAQILMHLFCCFLDEKIPAANPLYKEKPFSGQHFVTAPTDPDSLKSPIVIYQSHLHPPHFDLVINGEEYWEIKGGYNNLFHALVVFLYHIKKDPHYRGVLHQVHLNTDALQLLKVLV